MEERGERKGICDSGSIKNMIPLELNLNLNHLNKDFFYYSTSLMSLYQKTNILKDFTWYSLPWSMRYYCPFTQ